MHRKALADRYDLKAVDQMGIRIHRPNGGHISFFLATCFLVILSLVSMSSAALNSGEKAALEEILLRYPDLMNVPAWASTTTDGKYLGKSWEFGFDAVCASPGYDLYGVHCSEQGHIDGLFIDQFWGAPLMDVFTYANGLNYLKNMSTTEYSCVLAEILIRDIAQLENVEIPYLIPTMSLGHNAITRLWATEHSNLLFSSFTAVRHLDIQDLISPLSASITPLKAQLESLTFHDARFYVSLFAALDFASFSSLKRLEVLSPLVQEPGNRVSYLNFYFSTLETFTLRYAQNDLRIIVSGPNLVSVKLEGLTSVQLTSANLKSLKLSVSILGSANLSSLPLLEELSVSSLGLLELPVLPPLRKITFGSDVPNDFLCSYVTTSLVDLELAGVETVPDCLMLPTSLKRLAFTGPIRTMNAATFSNMPASIEELIISQDYYSSSWAVEEVLKFSNLKTLKAIGSAGPLPSDFLTRLPQLVDLKLESDNLTGTLPSRGWENIEKVQLLGRFTSFPGIEGTARRLKRLILELHNAVMQVIPSDDAMLAAQLDNLELISFEFDVSGPLPTFWTHLPKIREVAIYSAQYTGPLPRTIRAPLLSHLSLFNGQNLCGPLFEFEIPTNLERLALSEAQISGPFPASWNSKLKIHGTFDLSENYLTGTLPLNWITSQTSIMDLSDNPGLTGPFVLNGNFIALWSIVLSNTNLSLCGPPISTATKVLNTLSCDFANLQCPAAGACEQFWDTFCTSSNAQCGGTPAPYIAPPACVTPPPRPNALAGPPAPASEATTAYQPSFLRWLTLCLSIISLL